MPNTNSGLSKYALSLLLASCLLFALPAPNARADYAPGPAAIPGMLFYELKSQACMAEITTDKKTPLMRAAEAGNAEKVKALIAAGAKVNDVIGGHYERDTALTLAAREGHAEVVRLLLAAGAKPDLKDGVCETALFKAVSVGYYPDVIALLLKAGASPRTKNLKGVSALSMALDGPHRINVLLPFLEAGVWLSSRERARALSLVVCRDMDAVRAALKAKAKPDKETLFRAAKCGNAEVVRFLLAYKSLKKHVNTRDSFEEKARTPLMWAAENGNAEAVQALIEAGADVNAHALSMSAWNRVKYQNGKAGEADLIGDTPLILALKAWISDRQKVAVVKALIAAGADVNDRSWDIRRDEVSSWEDDEYRSRGETPLMVAAERGFVSLEVVKTLLAAGADLQAWDGSGKRVADKDKLMCKMQLISEEGDVEFVQKLLAAGADVNTTCSDENTPLIRAVMGGNAEIVQMLIAAGAGLNVRNERKQSALMTAARWGRPEALKVLLAAGADKKATHEDDARYISGIPPEKQGYTLLMLALPPPCTTQVPPPEQDRASPAARLEVVKALIAAGVDVQAANHRGRTALYYAADGGYTEAIRTLIAAGADVNARDEEGETPLMVAAVHRDAEAVQVLMRAALHRDAEAGQALMRAALHYADAEAVKLLIAAGAEVNARNESGRTPLLLAAAYGNAEAVKVLSAAGAEVNARDKDGETALKKALKNERWETVLALLKAGAEVNEAGIGGQMLKMIQAAERGEPEAAKALILAMGKDVNAMDDKLLTPLMFAARLGQAEAVKLLIAAGADVNKGDGPDVSPLNLAAEGGHVAVLRLLIAAGAKVKSTNQAQEELEDEIDRLRDSERPKAEIDKLSHRLALLKRSDVALISAVSKRHPEAVKLLLAAGANANAERYYSPHETALMSAAETDQPEMVKALIAAGAEVNVKIKNDEKHDDETALRIAVENNAVAAAKALIEGGADVNIKYKNGKTVHDLAKSEEMKEILKAAAVK